MSISVTNKSHSKNERHHADIQLLRQVAEGQESALRDLIVNYSPAVNYLCKRICGDEAMANELVSEVFWELWRRASTFDPCKSSVRSFLFMIARSRAIDLRRANAARLRALEAHREQMRSTTTHEETDLAGRGMMAAESRTQLHNALSEIPARQRQAVELAFLDGMTHEEIAERLESPLGTIKTRIRSGLKKLRSLLNESGTGELS